jgi:hypothetical protein
MARTGAVIFREASCALMLCSEHAQILAKEGYTKADDEVFDRLMSSPDQVPVTVAGARNAAISKIMRVFGLWTGKPVVMGGKA